MRRLDIRIKNIVCPMDGKETGAVTALTAVLTVVLLLMAAMVINTGMAYTEKAQLQNGADAAALAAANCISHKTCTTAEAQTMAASLVGENSNDGASNVEPLDFSIPGQVTATTTTLSNGKPFLTLPMSGITKHSEGRVAAKATATWGGIASGPAVLPFTFGACQVVVSETESKILLHSDSKVKKCAAWNPNSGLNGPGGFGYLVSDAACKTNVSIYATAPSSSGVGGSLGGCDGVLDANLNKIVLVPIFSSFVKSSPNDYYQIAGWGAFMLTGYSLPSNKPNKTGGTWSGGGTGLSGHFVKILTYAEGFTYGAPPDKFENAVVKLSK